MKSSLAISLGLLAFGGLGKAQSPCGLDVALPYSLQNPNQTAGAGDGDGSLDGADLPALEILEQGQQNALGLIGRGVGEPAKLIGIVARSLQSRRLLNKRQDFSCAGDETCHTLGNDGIFCSKANGDFHDPDGVTGNIVNGDYLLPDGRRGNLFNGPYPTLASDGAPAAKTAASVSASVPTKGAAATRTAATATITEVPTTITTNEEETQTSQASSTQSKNVPLVTTSSTSPTLPTGSPSSTKATTSAKSAVPGNGASSSLHLSKPAFAAVMSMPLLWWIMLC